MPKRNSPPPPPPCRARPGARAASDDAPSGKTQGPQAQQPQQQGHRRLADGEPAQHIVPRQRRAGKHLTPEQFEDNVRMVGQQRDHFRQPPCGVPPEVRQADEQDKTPPQCESASGRHNPPPRRALGPKPGPGPKEQHDGKQNHAHDAQVDEKSCHCPAPPIGPHRVPVKGAAHDEQGHDEGAGEHWILAVEEGMGVKTRGQQEQQHDQQRDQTIAGQAPRQQIATEPAD